MNSTSKLRSTSWKIYVKARSSSVYYFQKYFSPN